MLLKITLVSSTRLYDETDKNAWEIYLFNHLLNKLEQNLID